MEKGEIRDHSPNSKKAFPCLMRDKDEVFRLEKVLHPAFFLIDFRGKQESSSAEKQSDF